MHLIVKRNKKIGQTPKQLLDLLEKQTSQKYFHLGNLDVMAEGLMVFINGRLRFLEPYLKKLPKTYEFEVIEGFTTDTYDLLGLLVLTSIRETPKRETPILKFPFQGRLPLTIDQRPPKVSYKNLNSKTKLNRFLRGKTLPLLPKKQVKVYSFVYLGSYKVTKTVLLSTLQENFTKIVGDYRQENIFATYVQSKNKLPIDFIIRKYKIKVSSGFYVRSLVNDMAVLNKKHLTAYSIKRTKLGIWNL